MTKLDELNRRFSPPRPALRPLRRRAPSLSSVEVCDKIIATDPEKTANKLTRSPCVQASINNNKK